MLGTFVRMVRRRLLFVFCSLVHHSNRPLFMWLQSSTDQEPSKIPKPICRSLVTTHHDRVLSDKTLTGCVKGRQEIVHAPTKEKKGRPHGTQRRGSFYQIWCIRCCIQHVCISTSRSSSRSSAAATGNQSSSSTNF